MIINKKPLFADNLVFNWNYFELGRKAFEYILKLEKLKGRKILLPAYIGYSSKEGSGVFDPVKNTNSDFILYRLNNSLGIDIKDLKYRIDEYPKNVLFIIHYFGFKDENLLEIKSYAKLKEIIIIEDFAHALFTFLLTPEIDFDYGIFSLHKMLPLERGGLLLSEDKISFDGKYHYDLFRFNMNGIIKKRVTNYNYLLSELLKVKKKLEIKVLRNNLQNMVPQTFPILVKNRKLRDFLYYKMNEKGFGVVSLYHELIKEIDKSYSIEHDISNKILNLPVHQDTDINALGEMLDLLKALIKQKID